MLILARNVAGALALAALAIGCGAVDPPGQTAEALVAPQIGVGFQPCAYTDLATAIAAAPAGGVVVLQEGNVFTASGLIVTKALTIRTGSANCTTGWDRTGAVAEITANRAGQIAWIAADVIFRDLTLRDGTAQLGGVLAVDGAHKLTLNSVTVSGGDAQKGGGLYAASGAVVELKGETIITQNTANPGGLTDEGGAGVYLDGATLNMHDQASISEANDSSLDGGGIYALSSAITITDDAFVERNWASGDGGGIYQRGGTLSLTGVFVDANVARGDGGGIWGDDIRLTTSYAYIEANEAVGGGGGIRLSGADAVITSSYFAENSAGADGGSILADDSQLTIDGTPIAASTAGWNGGGIAMRGLRSTMTMIDGAVQNCTAGQSGGGVALSGGTATLQGAHLFNNAAAMGGALYVADTTAATVTSTWINGNTADLGGGVLLLAEDIGAPNLAMDGPQSGGACVDSLMPLLSDIYCSDIFENVGNVAGGGLAVLSGRARVDRTGFVGNQTPGTGSAIYLPRGDATSLVRATNCLFHDNVAGPNGATVEVEDNAVFDADQVTMANDVGIGINFDPGTGQLFRSIVDDVGGVFARAPFVLPADCSLVRAMYGRWTGPGRALGLSPGFVTTPRGPFRLAVTSMNSVDRCSTGAAFDLDSAPRPAYARWDRGAFEAQ